MKWGWAITIEHEVPKIMRDSATGHFMIFFYESLAKDFLLANPTRPWTLRRVEIEIKEVVE